MPVPFGKKVDITRVMARLAERNRYPIACMIDLTWRCTFRCRHCYQSRKGGRELAAGRWAKIFDDLASTGVLLLTFSGGEPLLRRDFFEIAREARRRTFSIKLKTNAWLLDDRAADFLKETGFEQVQISLYALRPAVHDAVTGVPGSHGRVMQAVDRLRARGVDVHLSMPVMSLNVDDIGAMTRLARRLGCDYAVDPSLTVCDDGSCAPLRLRAEPGRLLKIFRNPQLMSSAAFRKEVKRRLRRADEPVCNVGKSSFVVDPSGEVRPCAMLPLVIGDLTKKSLKRIWDESETLAMLSRLTWKDLHGCSECDLRAWCVRCHGSALIEDGDLMGPSRIACDVTRVRRQAALK